MYDFMADISGSGKPEFIRIIFWSDHRVLTPATWKPAIWQQRLKASDQYTLSYIIGKDTSQI